MVDIISRSQWGARAWNGRPHSVPLSARTHFLVHYHGGPPPSSVGSWVPKNIEAIHLGNGWSGVGYNFVVDQAGNVYEGRGWNLVGAHCPGKNRTGIGVQVAIGGNQSPTDAAMRSVVALYREANRRAGRTLTKGVHGDYYATACAGPKLTAWVHAGMKADGKIPTVTGGGSSGSTKYYQPTGTSLTVKQIQGIVGAKADGAYGPATKAAVKKYQQKLGVTADSLWGPQTEAAHFKAVGKPKSAPKSNPAPKPSTPAKLVVDGIEGRATVRALQRFLKVTVDGKRGPQTNRAMQKWLGVTQDGKVGPVTVRALQRKVGAKPVDGKWGAGTTRSLQAWLNKNG